MKTRYVTALLIGLSLAGGWWGWNAWQEKRANTLSQTVSNDLRNGNRALDARQIPEAERLLQRVLAVDAAYPRRDAMRGGALLSLGILERHRRNLPESERLYREALPLLEKSGDATARWQCQALLSGVLLDMAKIDEGAALLDETAAALERRELANERAQNEMRVLIGGMLVRLAIGPPATSASPEATPARLERAQLLLTEGLRYFEAHEPKAEKVPEAKYWLGNLAYQRGAFGQARELIESALATWREKPESHLEVIAGAYHTLGRTQFKLGEYSRAEDDLTSALDMLPQTAPDSDALGTAYQDMVMVQQRLGHLDAALEYSKRSNAVYRKAFGPKDLRLARGAAMQAHLHTLAGRYEQALEAYQEALDLYGNAPGETRMVAYMQFYMGEVAQQAGQGCRALDYYRKSQSLVLSEIPNWTAMLSELDRRLKKAQGPRHCTSAS